MSSDEQAALLYNIAKFIDANGNILVQDDIEDFGYFSYSGRGQGNPRVGFGRGEHPSPVHHWQFGMALKAIAHAVGTLAVAQAARDDIDHTKPFQRIVNDVLCMKLP